MRCQDLHSPHRPTAHMTQCRQQDHSELQPIALILVRHFTARGDRLLARVNRSGEFEVGEFTKKSELKDVAEPILRLMNETYTEVTGYSPLSSEEIHELTKRFMPMIDPRFVKVVYAKQQLVGFVVGVPDMAEGFRKSRGHLFPVGW